LIAFVEYWIANDAKKFRILENKEKLPWSLYVGLAGMPGQTAWMAWKEYAAAQKVCLELAILKLASLTIQPQ
jgi:NADPH-dependent curcumin reductase CurA